MRYEVVPFWQERKVAVPNGVRLTAYFSGYVQGVGFRFTAVHIARGSGSITGYVRNMRDGRVDLVAEGSRAQVQALLEEVERELGSYIRKVEVRYGVATGEFKDFGVRY